MPSGWIVSVNVGAGGVPKTPRPEGVRLGQQGLDGDVQGHEKHRKPQRAISILSVELLNEFQKEGFRVSPGLMAENVTVYGVDLCALEAGTRIKFEGGAEVEVASQRKPCYQLNPVGEGLEQAAVGRSGVMCSVITEGMLKPGMTFDVVRPS
ncbi:MAG: MOSC domain-containing protein [Planctomycetes bacterium]|nr:MOSC domain-containing protein [Planctomycetota bacterium]NUQ35506.1 MOSC domain-containing protein [Planctomycetaceae bacterium]